MKILTYITVFLIGFILAGIAIHFTSESSDNFEYDREVYTAYDILYLESKKNVFILKSEKYGEITSGTDYVEMSKLLDELSPYENKRDYYSFLDNGEVCMDNLSINKIHINGQFVGMYELYSSRYGVLIQTDNQQEAIDLKKSLIALNYCNLKEYNSVLNLYKQYKTNQNG